MKALFYILQRSVINYIKSFRKKPVKALGPVFMIIFIVLMFLPGKKGQPNTDPNMGVFFVTGVTVVTLGLLIYAVYKGTKKLKSYFLMSDVNLVFPSPIRPQTILLYGLARQIYLEIFISFWIIYQIPNIYRSFNVPVKNQVMLILAFILFQMVFCNCLKLMVFALCAKYKNLGERIRFSVKLLLVFAAAGIGLTIYSNRNQIEVLGKMVLDFHSSSQTKFIPVIGWMKELAYQSITHVELSFLIYFVLLIAASAFMIFITYGIELDYYEDVLSMAEDNEFAKKVQNGQVKGEELQYGRKVPKLFTSPLRRARLKLDGIYGAKTFFYKHVNEYFKRGVWFVNFYSLILLAVSIIYGLTPVREIKFLLFVFGVLLVYSSLGNKIQTEINYHYIYLIPDTSVNKVLYGSLSSLIKVSVDSLILFIPSGILMRSGVLDIILCILTYISFGVLTTFSGLFVYRVAGKIGLQNSQVLFALFMLLFQTLMLVPNLIVVLTVTFTLRAFGGYAIYLGMLFFNISGSALFTYGSRGILNNMEQNSLY